MCRNPYDPDHLTVLHIRKWDGEGKNVARLGVCTHNLLDLSSADFLTTARDGQHAASRLPLSSATSAASCAIIVSAAAVGANTTVSDTYLLSGFHKQAQGGLAA